MPKLNKKTIDLIRPTGKQFYCWDDTLPGFAIRVNAKGTKTFIVHYRTKARVQRFVTLGRVAVLTADEARDRARKLLVQVADGKDPKGNRGDIKTVSDLMDKYINEYCEGKIKNSTIEYYRRMIRLHIAPRFGTIDITDFNESHLVDFEMDRTITNANFNRCLAIISTVINLAEKLGIRQRGTSFIKYIDKRKEKSRDRFLTEDELSRLTKSLEKLRPSFKTAFPDLVYMLLLTGARVGEILNATWDHVDLDKKRLFLPDSKTGEGEIFLNEQAIKILKRLKSYRSIYVIHGMTSREKLKFPHSAWSKLINHAGIRDVRIHDLRHVFASYAHKYGASQKTVAGLLRHTQLKTAEKYIQVDNSDMKESSNKTGNKLSKIIGL